MEETTQAAAPASAPAASTVNDASAALAFADSSLATPETPETTPAAAVMPPTETPVEPASTPEAVDDPRSPFIPRERFDTVNSRMTKAEEALKQYEWAKDYQTEDLQSVATWAKAFKANPVEAVLHALQSVESDPQHAQALRSHFARSLSAGRKPAEPAADPEPEPDLQAQDGTLVYSATKQKEWRDWNNRQLTSTLTKSFEDKMQPLQKVADTFQQRESQSAYTSSVTQVLSELKAADPDFASHTKDVYQALEADPDLMRMALGDKDTKPNPRLAIRYAWNEVRLSKIVPQQLKDSEGKTLANLQQRAVAANANPATASTSTPKTTMGDARAALEHAHALTGS